MKKTAYVRLTDTKPRQDKSLLRKAAELFSAGENPSYTISGIYDERLVKTGVLVEYYLKDKNDDEMIKKYHSDITHIARTENCECIAFEDHSCVYAYPHDFTDGTGYILRYLINDLKKDDPLCEKKFVGAVLSAQTNEEHIKFLSDNFRYIMLYSKEKDVAEDIAEYIMHYNSTAVITTNTLRTFCENPVMISLSRSFVSPPDGYKGKFLCPYLRFADQPEEIRFHAYTDKFSHMALSASFYEVYEGTLNAKWLD